MADQQTCMFGFEILKKTVENDIKRPEDNLVVIFHWTLINKGFRCIGIGDAKEISGDEIQSELLPADWNATNTYLLRYKKDGKLFIARISKSSDDLLFNLIRGDDMKITSVIIGSDGEENEGKSDKEMADKFSNELVCPLLPPEQKTSNVPSNPINPIGTQPRTMPSLFGEDRRGDFGLGVGRSDLDPWNPVVPPTGMIFPMPGGRPRGNFRFDPINPEQGPLGPRGRHPWSADPDSDLFPPPGGGFYM